MHLMRNCTYAIENLSNSMVAEYAPFHSPHLFVSEFVSRLNGIFLQEIDIIILLCLREADRVCHEFCHFKIS